MPSPFPGMDPYLEAPARWRSVHVTLIASLMGTLNRQLPPKYVAEIDERLYVVQSDRLIYPDLAVVTERARRSARPNGGATILESDTPYVIRLSPREVREAFINIRRKDSQGRALTTLEVLSPSNKNPRSAGFRSYRQKQREVPASRVSLVEIDLLRKGQHTVAAPDDELDERRPWHYVVCLHRAGQRDRFETWPVTIRERLPRFCVPLEKDVRDEVVDLQEVLQRCYDEAGHARLLDYRVDPAVPLDPADAAWADDLLRKKGLRPRRTRRNGGRS